MAIAYSIQELSQVHIAELLDEEDVVFEHHMILKRDNIRVLKLHEDCNLSYGCSRNTIVLVIDVRLLDCIRFPRLSMQALVYNSIGALP